MDTSVASPSCAYDRIISTNSMSRHFTGKAEVLRFDELFELGFEPNATLILPVVLILVQRPQDQ